MVLELRAFKEQQVLLVLPVPLEVQAHLVFLVPLVLSVAQGRQDSQVRVVRTAPSALPDLPDSLVIPDSKDRRVGPAGLAEQAWLEELGPLDGRGLQARKV